MAFDNLNMLVTFGATKLNEARGSDPLAYKTAVW